ncbi:hypothetical protein ACFL1H_06340 [Nanoarchaeota archaeon]
MKNITSYLNNFVVGFTTGVMTFAILTRLFITPTNIDAHHIDYNNDNIPDVYISIKTGSLGQGNCGIYLSNNEGNFNFKELDRELCNNIEEKIYGVK